MTYPAPRIAVTVTQTIPANLGSQLGLSGAQLNVGAALSLPQNDALQLVRANLGEFTDVSGAATTGSKTVASAVLDFPSIAAAGQAELTVAVKGAVINDPVVVGPPANLNAGLVVNGRVTAAGTVTVRVSNVTAAAIDPASGTWRVAVVKF